MSLVVANFLVQESFVVAARGGLVTMLLKTSNKTIIFCSVTFYAWKHVNTFKDQNSEDGLSCIFQAIGIAFSYKRCKDHIKPRQGTTVRIKRIDPIWSQVCSLLNMSKKLLNTILKSNIQLQLSLSWFKHLTHLTPLSL